MIHSVKEYGIQNPSDLARGLEPVAIIGLGCRFPGDANDWRSFWRLLDSATDAISETPRERWNLQKFYASHRVKPGKTQSKWGGYVSGIDGFDPQLFGISPREAASMDPQQRMLLEVAYRALEDAGQPLEHVAGQPIAVFVGISSFDYAVANLSFQDRGVIDAYSNTGGSSSIAANRISYCFDLRGPSVAVDTACSSSLVAVHLACESIWRGEAHMALAGGVNALLMPDFYVAFSQLGVLSPDGRCKSFDARANGYVRSEGAGMAMLKPLSAAIRDKDPIYAVIRATGLNQDGRTPGMTVPSQQAQQELIRSTCSKASIRPSDIQYVEAHGTGTPVGDPIEATAIGTVVGHGRDPSSPCTIGSVKTNIGHLEAGAGIASLIKVALALHHRRIPAHLHFQRPNPAIDFAALNLRVPLKSIEWQSNGPRLAGINGFGYGGANAHVILEEAPASATRFTAATTFATTFASSVRSTGAAPRDGDHKVDRSASDPAQFNAPVLLPLSARSMPGLAEQARQFAKYLREGEAAPLAELAGFLAHRRNHHNVRAALTAASSAEMAEELRILAETCEEESTNDFSSGKLSRGVAFVCSGQGPQWWAMGRGLLRFSPAFRTVIKRCDTEFLKYGEWSLITELTRCESESRMQKTAIAQPSIFAVQVALAAVWDSWGIKPTAVVGHSVGEIAAAYLSGALNWEDACCVAYHRGRTMDLASSQGAMLAAGLSASEVSQWLQGIEQEVSIAAINGPSSITISGVASAIEQLARRLDKAGIFCRRLAVEYAFHSPQMDPVREELLRSLSQIKPQPTHTTLISTVTGKMIEGEKLDADYWWQNVRQSVRFIDAMHCLSDMGYGVAVEIGPHPVLAYSINECFQAAGTSIRTIPSLNRQQDDLQCITKSLGSLYSLGFDIHWTGFYNRPTRRIDAPTYPFQTQRCWSESFESYSSRTAAEAHPLLGESCASPTPQWQQRIDLKLQGYLSDHAVRGAIVYPAAAMLETAFAALGTFGERAVRLQRVRLHNPCVLSEDRPQWIQTSLDSSRDRLSLAFRQCDSAEWSPLATIDFSSQPPPSGDDSVESFSQRIVEARERCTDKFERDRLYQHCRNIGLCYGPAFQGAFTGQRTNGEAVVEVSIDSNLVNSDSDRGKYFFHPALLDSCFHSMIAADPDFDHTVDGMYLPVEIDQVNFYRRPTDSVTVIARCLRKSKKLMVCDLDIYDSHGRLCAAFRGFESRRVNGGTTKQTTEDLIYSYSWSPKNLTVAETVEPGAARRWIVFMDEGGVGRELNQRLAQRGDRVVEIYRSDSNVSQAVTNRFYQAAADSLPSMTEAISAAVADLQDEVDEVVFLWGLDAPDAKLLTCERLRISSHLTTLAPLYLVQAWEKISAGITAELTIVTAGAQSTDGIPECTAVSQAALIGFGRVIASEYARLPCSLVDLPGALCANDMDCLLQELLSTDDEDEVMWREGVRFVHRFGSQADKQASSDAARELPCQLRIGGVAGIEELRYVTKPCAALALGEVEIEVHASGLNFSDVMKALDLYPGLPDGVVDLGAECSGRISRVAPESRWSVGDEVIAIAPGAFGTHVIANELLVARKPSTLSHEQAAAIPVAFLTAQYALNDCARLRTGDSVLIHAASGGVGLAALQLAKLAGVRILATAGSEEKRQFVRDQGAVCVMDSRSLAFGSETLAATKGLGVDAVLNSLPGEAIRTGLAVLKTGGRFLEIGKRDIYSDASLGLYPFRNNLALFAIDLDQLFKQQPARMGALLQQLVERFEANELQALPVRSYPADETKAALRFMQQGKHIGKVVVSYKKRPTEIQNGEFQSGGAAKQLFDSNGTYWIAGGLGGFGLEIVRWMAKRGARSLVLSGRSSSLRPAAKKTVAELRDAGVNVSVLPADITQADDVRRVLRTINDSLPPLRGVIHTAMVLEDKLLVDLDRETLERVLWPKMLGGWNLHQETQGLKLDCFILFSSLSSVFGHAGQANYSAANAVLDSLAYFRRSQGLPATVVNWGHLGEVGYLAEREQLGQRLERQGVLSFSVQQATDCLEYALLNKALQLSVLRIDWSVWRGLGVTSRISPRFSHLLCHASDSLQACDSELLTAQSLRNLGMQDRCGLIERQLRIKMGGLLGTPPEKIPSDRALLEMGLDSLMAVELRNWIESQMQINVPISSLMRSESMKQVVSALAESVDLHQSLDTLDPNRSASGLSSSQAEELLEQLPNLDADEVAQLLSQMLRDN